MNKKILNYSIKIIEKAQSILLGRMEGTSPNTVLIKTSAKISSKEIQKILGLGFEEFEITPDIHYTTNVLLIWKKVSPEKAMPAEIGGC